MEENKEREVDFMRRLGLPGCFGSWDWKHYLWKNFLKEVSGQHTGKEGSPTLIIETICDTHMYIWYLDFGEPGLLNDINILDRSSIAGSILEQKFDTK